MRKVTRDLLSQATTEKDVENAYRAEIKSHIPSADVISPFHSDGYFEWKTVRMLLEAKYDEDLKNRVSVCGVLGQMLYYLKKFEKAGELLPNALFIGDKNECLVLSTASVEGFLNTDIDWSTAPSSGNPELLRALVNGINLLPYVYDVDEHLNFRDVLKQVESLAEGELHAVRATLENIGAMFIYWQNRVFNDKTLTPVEQVDVFLRCLFQPSEVSPHPTKKGVLVVPGYTDGVLIKTDPYKSFFGHFKQGYKPSEIEAFYAMKDRLVEDDARRRQGAFFTPTIWVCESHKEIEKSLGANWKEECIVWDAACGTGNLTRDHVFKDLILSTAEKPDVDVIKEQGYNAGASVFQFDFLNPGTYSPFFPDLNKNLIPDEVDAQLRAAAKSGKRLVFFMNPPYGTANNAGAKGTSKRGIADTVVNAGMKKAKLGSPSQQLYAQFMFQCHKVAKQYGFKEITVGQFSKHTFMCSGSYKKFRDWWYSQFEYKSGFMFQASHFADVSGRWGVTFTVWNSGGRTPVSVSLPLMLKDIDKFSVTSASDKIVYNSDGREASKWVREPIKGLKGGDVPQMSSGLVVKSKGHSRALVSSFGFLLLKGNSLMESGTGVALVSAGYVNGHGLSVLPSNFSRCVALYAARKLVNGDWINDKDEYLVPEETHPDYEQWVNDCHVYDLLHTSNNCTSMRDVSYKENNWTIKNHWFWKTRQEALALLDTEDTPTLYRDCKGEVARLQSEFAVGANSEPWAKDGDAYLAHLLESGQATLSPDAQDVLDKLNALWSKSLPLRENYAAGKPELHLMTWDAGIYQTKHIFRDLFPVEWQELRDLHKKLAERLQDGVYEFGFLKR
jgi:hypothetical protein